MSPTAFCSHCGTHLNVSLTDAYSFSCNLIIKKAEHLWCVAQCSVDGISFLQFDNINKTTPSGNLGNMANATEVRRCLTQHLEDLGWELRSKMENLRTTGKCGIEYRSRDVVRKGRGEGMWECDGECICMKELSTGPTLEAQGTQWLRKSKSCGNDPGT